MKSKQFVTIAGLTVALMMISACFGYCLHKAYGQYGADNKNSDMVDWEYRPDVQIPPVVAPGEKPDFIPDISPIVLQTPIEGQLIASPLVIKGQAPGTYFFEGDFPLELEDGLGNVLATGIAKAQGEWMTEDLVSFQAQIKFDWESVLEDGTRRPPTGALKFIKNDPSGQDAMIRALPVLFEKGVSAQPDPGQPLPKEQREKDGCVISGCSSQLCGEESMMSDCMFEPKYMCFGKAMCEKQDDGTCGWTITDEIGECVQQMY